MIRFWSRFSLIFFLAFYTRSGAPAHAFPINTDVAIQPAEGEFIYRSQLRYVRASEESGDPDGKRLLPAAIRHFLRAYRG